MTASARKKSHTQAPKKVTFTLSIALSLIIGGILVLIVKRPASAPGMSARKPMISLKGQSFTAQIADTSASREKGLSDQPRLAADEGMLFIFQRPDEACFWMKDMRFNLDILWFDAQKKLIYQRQDLAPATYPQTFCPPMRAMYVVEVNADTSSRLGLRIGDTLTFQKQ